MEPRGGARYPGIAADGASILLSIGVRHGLPLSITSSGHASASSDFRLFEPGMTHLRRLGLLIHADFPLGSLPARRDAVGQERDASSRPPVACQHNQTRAGATA